MSIITELITYRSEEHPNLLWLEVKTKEGVTGLGETFFAAEAIEAYIHRTYARAILTTGVLNCSIMYCESMPCLI
jgi:galactonate dehydratase